MKIRLWQVTSLVVLAFVTASCGGNGGSGPPTQPGPGTPTESFSSGNLGLSAPTNLFVHRFNNDGDWAYQCTNHQPNMDGTVHVAAAGADSPTVTITSNQFTPATVNVKTGGYVKWVNTQGVHNVTR